MITKKLYAAPRNVQHRADDEVRPAAYHQRNSAPGVTDR